MLQINAVILNFLYIKESRKKKLDKNMNQNNIFI